MSDEVKCSFVIVTATANHNRALATKNDSSDDGSIYIDEEVVNAANVLDPYEYLISKFIECTDDENTHTLLIQNLHLILNSLTKENKFINEIQKMKVKYNKRIIIGMRDGGFYA